MGTMILLLILAFNVNHVYYAEELTGDFYYLFPPVGGTITKFGDTIFCFSIPECSDDFRLSLCLIDKKGENLGCITDPEDVSPIVYMYPLDQSTEHCVVFSKKAAPGSPLRTQLNIWKEDTLIIQVKP